MRPTHMTERIGQIEAIGHVQRLRIHSRLPVVLPGRVTPGLCNILEQTRLQAVVVVHCNHANEVDGELVEAFAALKRAGVTLLNQTVLLAGVNDCADRLESLSQALFSAGVMPYYLHLLDQVSGAAHFDLPEARALAIYRELMASTSGYLVPRLVRECPEKPSKVPLAPYDWS